jgi:hypothetical protein
MERKIRWKGILLLFPLLLFMGILFLPVPAFGPLVNKNLHKVILTKETPLYQSPITMFQPEHTISPQEVIVDRTILGWYRIQTSMGNRWIKQDSTIQDSTVDFAQGKPYKVVSAYPIDDYFRTLEQKYADHSGHSLTDGEYGGTRYPHFVGMYSQGSRTITLDLQRIQPIEEIAVDVLQNQSAGIYFPRQIHFYLSNDKIHWQDLNVASSKLAPTIFGEYTQRIGKSGLHVQGRYVKMAIQMLGDSLFLDEVEVWGKSSDKINLSPNQSMVISEKPDSEGDLSQSTPSAAKKGYPAPKLFNSQVLIYTGSVLGQPDWITFTKDDFKPYVSYLDKKGVRKDFLFDSFLFVPFAQLDDGVSFDPSIGKPSRRVHWEGYMERLFREGHELGALEEAVKEAKKELKNKTYKAKVFIGIPFPRTDQNDFGDVDGDGVSENLAVSQVGEERALENRAKVVEWFTDQVRKEWAQKKYPDLELTGFYWFSEYLAENKSIYDDELIRRTSRYLHASKEKFEWIPYYFSYGWDRWDRLGFDVAILQPNYMFHLETKEDRIDISAQAASDHGLGIEVELREEVLQDRHLRERFYTYLRKGKEYGYDKSYRVFYQENKVLKKAYEDADPAIHELYDQTYHYIKGK